MPNPGNNCCNCGVGPTGTKLCVQVQTCSFYGTANLNGCTVRFQGPNGEDRTVNLDTATSLACYDRPAVGTWTITVSHYRYTTQVITQAVTLSSSITRTVTLVLSFTTLSYSDPYGSLNLDITGVCFKIGRFTYTSTDCCKSVDCGGGSTRCLRHQTGPVDPEVTALLGPDSTGDNLVVELYRKVRVVINAGNDCAHAYTTESGEIMNSGDAYCTALGDCNPVGMATISLSVPTGSVAITTDTSGTYPGPPEAYVTATVSFS